ncbi:MAG: phosphatidylserine decarboxylase [Myxococcales bacterium]|nr:phosphatidylserine decarboxylase [Myxococcales bacterium]
MTHQYVARSPRAVHDERLYSDRIVRFLYSEVRERAPAVFRAVTGGRASALLGFLNYDFALGAKIIGVERFARACGLDLSECLDDPATLTTPRELFERRIRYWECRPMPEDPRVVVSPADARVLVGSLCDRSALHVKGKFFTFEELLGADKRRWLRVFDRGDWAIFRLTPDKYHYNHAPVAGRVVDLYAVDGDYHSCNPSAVVSVATPYSKNKRVVTILDTDVPGGTGVGHVAMIEVVALMIGEIVQCYSDARYEDPRPARPGMFVRRGAPKSLYRPGSSTDILLFERERVRFSEDLLHNRRAAEAASRFSLGFGTPLVETDVAVRSEIAGPAAPESTRSRISRTVANRIRDAWKE